jgi:hypothetical protein
LGATSRQGKGRKEWAHLLPQLGADVMHMNVERTSRKNQFLPGDHLRRV